MTGQGPVKEEPPELPPYIGHVWSWWLDLHRQRRRGFGPEPISYADIEARGTVMRDPALPWEAWAIRQLDDVYLAWHAEQSTSTTTTAPPSTIGPPR